MRTLHRQHLSFTPGGAQLCRKSVNTALGPGVNGADGVVGTITIAGGPEAPTGATTSAPVSLPASHGLVYDPFSDSFISMGDDEISRFSSAGVLLETLGFAGQGVNFDQGTVDGLGHIFAADNNGRLYLVAGHLSTRLKDHDDTQLAR